MERLEGEWKLYRKNGKLRKIENYKNGEANFCRKLLISFPKLRDSSQVLAVFLSF